MMTIALSKENCAKLLGGQLSPSEASDLLKPAGFKDWESAYQTLQQMTPEPRREAEVLKFLPHFLLILSNAASPDRVLSSFFRFSRGVPNDLFLYRYLANNPRVLEILVTLFAGSEFLSEILLRNPNYFERLVKHQSLAQPQTPEELRQKVHAALASCWDEELDVQLNALRRFQRWQLLRIGTGDLLGLLDIPTITGQLSHLADALVDACLEISAHQTRTNPDNFIVLAMGKLGGGELNYSSDIDLIFLSTDRASDYERLGKVLIDALTRVTAEGFLYRVDMRLRPWGGVGSLVNSVDVHLKYLQEDARLWEWQAMLKARPIAGDKDAGEAFLQLTEDTIFAAAPEIVQTDVRAMKKRIEDSLHQKGRGWGEIKLGEGSIRDIEFVTQYLQMAHGDTHPQVRSRNTLDGLARLATAGFLTLEEHRVLADGYAFLRSTEHWLQMMHYRQVHTLPTDGNELKYLAQRLGFSGGNAGERFLERYSQHSAAIRAVYQTHLGNDALTPTDDVTPENSHADISKHLERLSPAYAVTFSQTDIRRHAALANRLDKNTLVQVDAKPIDDGQWLVTIVGFDYLGALSSICGLLFAYGLDIHEGHVFTYRKQPPPSKQNGKQTLRYRRSWQSPHPRKIRRGVLNHQPDRQKIVDVFVISPAHGNVVVSPEMWMCYTEELSKSLRMLEAGDQQKAQGAIAKRLAIIYQQSAPTNPVFYPVDIEIDNDSHHQRTIIRLEAADTIGFLYEFTNALALIGMYIARVHISVAGNRAFDVLHINDKNGKKITDPTKTRELRAAAVLTKHFTNLLPNSPNPEAALINFRQFLQKLFARPNWPDELISVERPEVLQAVSRLLGASEFLWADFMRMQYANLFPLVRDVDELSVAYSKAELQARLMAAIRAAPDKASLRNVLNEFKDQEMFRIDMRHILGHTARFGQFSAELTDLAEVVVESAYHVCRSDLESQYGKPALENGEPCAIAVCALGKCGGRELGFASDIELIFVYAGKGQTIDGLESISCAAFYEKLVQEILQTIRAKREGIFELDLRLRPYGKAGSMAVPLRLFKEYYAPDGPAWAYERQAMVKLRSIAGDREFGREIMTARDEMVYTGQPFDAATMHGMRERQIRHLVTPGTINVKHSPGALVDIEYLVQGLQITYGADNPDLRLPHTGQAMTTLHQHGILSKDDYLNLRAAHIFLRRLINALRMVHGNAKDLTVPPTDSEGFAFLARRLNYENTTILQDDISKHTSNVQEISARLLG